MWISGYSRKKSIIPTEMLLLSVLTVMISLISPIVASSLTWTDPRTPVFMCESKIYCQGPILEAVNRLAIYNDSKHYVDMPLKNSPADTLTAFNKLFPNPANITREALQKFLEEYFYEPGGELSTCTPEDWKPEPDTFKMIKDPKYRKWANDLQQVWLKLCRRMNASVLSDFDKNSLIYVPNNFIVPGGRFREYYYWDTYWIVRGLLVSEMYQTVKGILRNFAYVVTKIGFIPNGGRIYYLQRSQPPFFIPMIYEYYMETFDKDFIREVLPVMEQELKFWRQNRTVPVMYNGTNYTVYRYLTSSNTPRPESYKEDVQLALNTKAERRPQLYQHIATAAESGLDFGSRYFGDLKDMVTIDTGDILAVDLNAFICWNHNIMHLFHLELGNHVAARDHAQKAHDLDEILNTLFYNETLGSWFDVDLENMSHLQHFYPTNVVPLFTGCYDTLDTSKPKRLYEYLRHIGALSYPSGIPSSLIETGQQWDLPNGWPPQNHMIIEGFRKSGHEAMQEDAFQIADAWLRVNYLVYQRTGHMYEKYNVSDTSYQPGGGGEYEVQAGFGWTNGVVLDLLRTYGARLVAPDASGRVYDHPGSSAASTILLSKSSPFSLVIISCLFAYISILHNNSYKP